MTDVCFRSFPEDSQVYPMMTLKAYEERTEVIQAKFSIAIDPGSFFNFCLACTGQHDSPVSSCTIARWLKCFMEMAGIDIFFFKAKPFRGASCLTVAGARLQLKTSWILQTGHWKANSSDFAVGILREMTRLSLVQQSCSYMSSNLSSNNSYIWTEPSEM